MNRFDAIVEGYLGELKRTLDALPREVLFQIVEAINQAREADKTVYICGNGGSGSTASHMVCDFSKNTRMDGVKRLKSVGLTDNIPSMTAYANDEGYDRIFAEPIITFLTPGDVLIAISGSGNSPNVLRGVEAAKEIGATTIGLTGMGGGKLKDLVDICLIVPSDSMERTEDVHMIVDHLLTNCLRQG